MLLVYLLALAHTAHAHFIQIEIQLQRYKVNTTRAGCDMRCDVKAQIQIKTKQRENEYKLFKWLLTMKTLFILRIGRGALAKFSHSTTRHVKMYVYTPVARQPLLVFTYWVPQNPGLLNVCVDNNKHNARLFVHWVYMAKCVCLPALNSYKTTNRSCKSAKVSFILLQLNHYFLLPTRPHVHIHTQTRKHSFDAVHSLYPFHPGVEWEFNSFGSLSVCYAKIWQNGSHITQQ